jgi:AAA family ATP:ADP antiporter
LIDAPPNRLQRIIGVRRDELAAVVWSWLFFFCVFFAYYVIRPIRDDMAVASGVDNLPWLFTGSLAGMLLANPGFAFLAARLPRARYVRVSYRIFALNLLIFSLAFGFGSGAQAIWAGRLFFVWTSVFNMFVVSIFWSVMSDVFSPPQSARLFGIIGAAGTVGGIAGAAFTSALAGMFGPGYLLLVPAIVLEVGAWASWRLFAEARRQSPSSAADRHDALLGGGVWEGFRRAMTSPYLLNISLHMLFFTVLTTLLYFQQATLVDAAYATRAERTRFFANVDLTVNVLTLFTQVFATGRLVQMFGLTASLVFLPAISAIGFVVLGATPTIAVLVIFQVLRRAGNFAVARPARETLFTVVSREDRYKAKSFIDTFVYRAGDQVGAWTFAPLATFGMSVGEISSIAAVLAAVSIVNAFWLGRRARTAAADAVAAVPEPTVDSI